MSYFWLIFIVRIFWALFLGLLLAGAFRGAWNAEHGKKGIVHETRKDRIVWLDPLIFPLIIILYLVLFLTLVPWREMMFTSLLTDMLVFVTVYSTLLLLLLPVLRKYFTARTCATLWLIPVFLFYQPQMLYNFRMMPPGVVLYVPGRFLTLATAVWVAGFGLILCGYLLSHVRYAWRLRKYSRPVEDKQLQEIWDRVSGGLDFDTPVKLRYCSRIRTPLSVGLLLRHTVTYLPEQEYSETEAELIFSHEIHHIQRRDTHTKMFLKFCCALGWIHPFTWAAVKKAEEDLELSCDEIVLKDADEKRRREYAELLLTTAGRARGFTTCLSASARTLRYRMQATLHQKRKWLGTGVLFGVMFLSCFATGWFSLSTERQPVSELLQFDAAVLESAGYDPDYNQADGEEERALIRDMRGLTDYLSGLEADRVLFDYMNMGPLSDEALYMTATGPDDEVCEYYIFGDYLEINNSELYHLSEPFDWEYIRTLE